MPVLPFTQSIAAGATFDPLENANFQYAIKAGILKINHNATATGLLATITSGTDQLAQESPVPAGGVAGVVPSDNVVPPIIDRVAKGDRLSIRYRNPTGGAITVNGQVDLTYRGGKR